MSFRSDITICNLGSDSLPGTTLAKSEWQTANGGGNSLVLKILPVSLTRSRFCRGKFFPPLCFQDFARHRGEGGVPRLSAVSGQWLVVGRVRRRALGLKHDERFPAPKHAASTRFASGHDLGRAEKCLLPIEPSRLQSAAQVSTDNFSRCAFYSQERMANGQRRAPSA